MNVADCQPRQDVGAFIALVDRYRTALISYLVGLGVPRADAEELAQEAFCRAWQHLPTIRPDRLVSWLYRTAHNLAVSLSRRPRIAALGEDPTGKEATKADDPTVAVHRAVAELPEEFRIVVALRHFNQMHHEDIAAALNIAAGTVRSRLSRAYERLRPLLAHLLEEC